MTKAGADRCRCFPPARLRPSREGTPQLNVLQTLVAYRLIDPGSEWRLHRHWFDAKFDVLLYDLTGTYFETDTERGPADKRPYGYSRDKRADCRQVVIALIVTPEGFPLSYEVLSGNTADSSTLSGFLQRIEHRYGKANRIWVMDRGVPTEDSLAKMRTMGASYLAYCLQVTLKVRLRRLAHGLTPAEVIAKFKSMQMVNVHVPTTDGRELIFSRYTQPETEQRMLLDQLDLKLPKQPPPKITAKQVPRQ